MHHALWNPTLNPCNETQKKSQHNAKHSPNGLFICLQLFANSHVQAPEFTHFVCVAIWGIVQHDVYKLVGKKHGSECVSLSNTHVYTKSHFV